MIIAVSICTERNDAGGYSFLNLSSVSLLIVYITYLLVFRYAIYHSEGIKSQGKYITNYIMDEHDVSLDREIRCHYDGLLAKDNAFVDG